VLGKQGPDLIRDMVSTKSTHCDCCLLACAPPPPYDFLCYSLVGGLLSRAAFVTLSSFFIILFVDKVTTNNQGSGDDQSRHRNTFAWPHRCESSAWTQWRCVADTLVAIPGNFFRAYFAQCLGKVGCHADAYGDGQKVCGVWCCCVEWHRCCCASVVVLVFVVVV